MAKDEMVSAALDPESLRRFLATTKEFSPKLATNARRELRDAGDPIIARQRAILSGPLPRGIAVVGQRKSHTRNKKTGRLYTRMVNVYEDAEVRKPGRSTGMRDEIKAGLKTRVVSGKTRAGLSIRSTAKTPMKRAWQAERFRHPAWGRPDSWVYQAGQPYFFKPIYDGMPAMRAAIAQSVNRTLDQIADKS